MKRKRLPTAAQYREMAQTILGEELLGQRGRRLRDEASMARRAAQMSVLYHDHFWSMDQVGAAFGCSRERVRQIFDEYSLPSRSSPTRKYANRP